MQCVTSNSGMKEDKIILMTLPFLTPICPPLGISCLKGYLSQYGYNVKTIDVMNDITIREVCYQYFDTLKGYIDEQKRGHFFNVGLDVLCNHFMAHQHYESVEKYRELVKKIIELNFYIHVDDEMVSQINSLVDRFYTELEKFLVRTIEKEKPTVLGISVYRGTLAASMFAFRIIKERYPEIMTVMGGAIFSQELYIDTPNYHYFLKKASFIDKFLVGEGERLFLKLLRGELPEGKKVYTIEDAGVELLDLTTMRLPDFSDFNMPDYPLLPHYTSRGCVYQCSFCAETVYWKKYRKKNAGKIVDEFVELSQRYGRRIFLLTDCLINPIVDELSKEIVERDLPFYWDVYLKVDPRVCSTENTFLWRRGGFYRARLGIESGSQKVLDIIDKKITIKQIKDALYSLATAGIKTTTYWIAGHPGETEEDFMETLNLLEEMQDYIYEAECDPFRYFYRGQVNANMWAEECGNSLLYPEDSTDMLITQTWTLNTYPSREEVYDRARRFKEHCKKLGIPNPYSISEIYSADERWKKLQRNAVPSLMDLNKGEVKPDESKKVVEVLTAFSVPEEDADFNF